MHWPKFTTKRAVLAFFSIGILLILGQSCFTKKNNIPEYHAFLSTDNFKNADRNTQLAQCASCHKDIYENEQQGPHALAYNKLLEHREFVNSAAYQCSFYTVRVNRDFEDCVGCHAPQNMLQTIFFDSLNDNDKIIKKILKKPVPPKRVESMRLSGIDCLSCHYDGNTIVSLKHELTADDSSPSKQTSSTMMNNNLNCLPCHMQIVKSFNASMSIRETGSAMCVNCHQEYVKGKPTHYYYWQHGSEDRKNPILKRLTDDFHFELTDTKTGVISWVNTVIPHGISSGPEVIIECEILDSDSNILGKQTIRANNKKLFDEEMYKHMSNNYLYGTVGDTIPLDGKVVKYSFPVKNSKRMQCFKVSLYHKAQYWFPDTLKVLTDVKINAINKQ